MAEDRRRFDWCNGLGQSPAEHRPRASVLGTILPIEVLGLPSDLASVDRQPDDRCFTRATATAEAGTRLRPLTTADSAPDQEARPLPGPAAARTARPSPKVVIGIVGYLDQAAYGNR